jgi:tetratricopeptide (TPR) repeat protein
MPPADTKICPSCQSRNKATWEFCARCGESLAEVKPGGSSTSVPVVARPAAAAAGPGIPWAGLLSGAVLLGGAWMVFQWRPQAVYPPPETFTIGTTPSPRPPTPAPVVKPGDEAFARALQLQSKGDREAALEAFAEAVSEDGERAEFREAHAMALWDAKKREQALAELGEASRLAPEKYRPSYAKYLNQAGRIDDAAREYEGLMSAGLDDPVVLFEFGGVLLEQKKTDQAILVMRRVTELMPGNAGAYKGLAAALERTKDWPRVEAAYRKVVELEPGSVLSRSRLAESLMSQNKKDAAIAVYQEGLAQDPESADLHRYLGGALERAGKLREAAAAYRDAVRLAPNSERNAELTNRANLLAEKANVVAGG